MATISNRVVTSYEWQHTVLSTEEYRGWKIKLVSNHVPAWSEDYDFELADKVSHRHIEHAERNWVRVQVDGRSSQGWNVQTEPDSAVAPADLRKLVAKAKKHIDLIVDDNRIRPQVSALIGRVTRSAGWTEVDATTLKVGDVAAVHGTGYLRRGLVVKVGRKNATVAYTTPSSAGRIFRKSASVVYVETAR